MCYNYNRVNMMASKKKIFKNLDEQIEILKNRGLTINDIDAAKNILFKENYFFISGYRHLFTKNYKSNVNYCVILFIVSYFD